MQAGDLASGSICTTNQMLANVEMATYVETTMCMPLARIAMKQGLRSRACTTRPAARSIALSEFMCMNRCADLWARTGVAPHSGNRANPIGDYRLRLPRA